MLKSKELLHFIQVTKFTILFFTNNDYRLSSISCPNCYYHNLCCYLYLIVRNLSSTLFLGTRKFSRVLNEFCLGYESFQAFSANRMETNICINEACKVIQIYFLITTCAFNHIFSILLPSKCFIIVIQNFWIKTFFLNLLFFYFFRFMNAIFLRLEIYRFFIFIFFPYWYFLICSSFKLRNNRLLRKTI